MPDIFYELNKVPKKERIDVLVGKIAVILFVLIQIPIFFVFATGEPLNIIFAIIVEIIIITELIFIYFQKITLALFVTSLVFYAIFAIIPYMYNGYHLTVAVAMSIFIFNTYVFEKKRLQYLNLIALGASLASHYTTLYFYYPTFLGFIVDSSTAIISLIIMYVVIDFFKKDVKKYEEKLCNANNFLVQITDLNPHFIYAKDSKNRFIFINKTMAEFYDCLPNEMIGKQVGKFYESSEILARANSVGIARNNSNLHLVKVMDVNNELTYHELIQTPIFDEHNRLKVMLGVAINITKKKKAEIALQENEQRYKQLYENNQMGIISVRNGRFSTVNDKFCAMTGYTKAEIIGEKIVDIMHPTDYEATLGKTKRVDIGKTKGEVFEHRFVRKDGTVGHALLHHQLLSIEGKTLEAMATLTDISQLKTTEKALRKSEKIYRKLIENAFDGIEIHESTPPEKDGEKWQHKLLVRNDRVYDILKKIKFDVKYSSFSMQEILAMSPEYQANEKKSADYIQDIRHELQKNGVVNFEWIYGNDVQSVHTEMTITEFKFGGKKYITTIYKDITEEKKAEYELKRRETLYRSIFNYAYDGIEIYEIEDNLVLPVGRNEQFRKILGRTDEELDNYEEVNVSPEYQPNGKKTTVLINEQVDNLIRNKKTQYEWQAMHKDGYFIDLEVTSILFDLDGKKMITSIYRDLTEQKKAEIALRESEAMYRYLFENAFDGIEIYEFFPTTGRTGKLLQRNGKLQQLFGKTDMELKDEDHVSMLQLSPELQPNGMTSADMLKTVQKEFRKHNQANIEWRFTHTQNHFIDVQLFVHTYNVGQKHVYMGIYKDITEKKKAEMALQKSEAMYRYLFENAFDGIEIYNYDNKNNKEKGLFLRNQKFRNLIGRKDSELYPMNKEVGLLQISPKLQANGLDSLEHRKNISKELAEKKKTIFEWRFLHKNKHIVDTLATLHTFKLGETQLLIGIYKDITEKKKSEIALHESEAMYRHLFENAFDGIEIYEYDKTARAKPNLVARNDKLRHLLGRTDEEIDIGKEISTLRISPDIQPNGRKSKEYLMEKQTEFAKNKMTAFDWQFTHKKGRFIDVHLILKEYDVNNKVILIGIYKDITEQKKNGKIIQQNLEQLQQKNEELQKFIKSNMQLENFAYLASHDLKEPIRTIVSFSQLLKRSANDKLSEVEREYIDFVIAGSKNMSMLIEDLLAYSRVDTEDKNIQNIKVEDMLYTINYELNTLIKSKNATIDTKNLPENINADKVQMRQLFQNLITNAIRYSAPERPPIVHISAQEQEKEWLFKISDNGIGIKPEFYERIFLLFRKLHNERDKGTGIGLALCKKITENHGGQIWVESEEGKGSDFYFTINKNLN